jgi:flagellar L-ring protein precursor FlgH
MKRLKDVGRAPVMAPTQDPTTRKEYKPVEWKNNDELPKKQKAANSLWQPGARAFFRDQRARRVGDILKVVVKIKNNASLNNKTENSRDHSEETGITSLYGLENKLSKYLPTNINPSSLVNLAGNKDMSGSGKIERKEDISTEVAAIVTQILPNGNLVIDGHQEIRVNYELREITVAGIVRSEDISADNSIASDQIAEARISYGGRGVISDIVRPRPIQQVVEALSPF